MRRNAERHLVVLATAVSLGLTGLTVWAVARQGGALLDRELADLRNAAVQAAAQRTAELRGDLERACGTAWLMWQAGRTEGLNVWLEGQRRWCLGVLRVADGDPIALPITPTQLPLPDSHDSPPIGEPASPEAEAAAALARLELLADSDDPLTRARALVGVAASRRRMGSLRAAAHAYAAAAAAFRASPAARYAFTAELGRLDCLRLLGDTAQARQVVQTLLERMSAAHPARYSVTEVDAVRDRVAALPPNTQTPRFNQQLDDLARRAGVRDTLPAVAQTLSALVDESTESADEGVSFKTVRPSKAEPLVVVVRRLSETAWIGLAVPAAELIEHSWPQDTAAPWRIAPNGAAADEQRLCRLGPAFGDADLVPSVAAAARLAAQSRRRTALVVATAVGTAAAWGIVIWMMLRAMARQRELVRLQRRFVADVSHELKTPLTMIRLLAETLQDGRVRDPARARTYYETITREAERLSVLLDGILDFSRIESEREPYELEDCEVADVARQAWALFEPQFVLEGFDHQLEISADLPTVRADAAALQQVLVNLLQNAYRYAGDGKYIRMTVGREGYLIVITVEDHGIGMTRAQLQRLGDSFFRAEDTRVRQSRGTGLGLAIVDHIVRAHGGKIEVHSRPNQGSKFTVWIPFEPTTKSQNRQ